MEKNDGEEIKAMSELDQHIFIHTEHKDFLHAPLMQNRDFFDFGEEYTRSIYTGIDLFKGFLLLTVITYHAMGGHPHHDPLQFWIITMTMPLFTALSGFLINEKFIESAPFYEIFLKYWRRMVKDWLIVFIIMFLIDIYLGLREDTFYSFIYSLVFPPYHLWYVPALMTYIGYFWALKRLNLNDYAILAIALIFSMGYGLYMEYILAPKVWDKPYSISYGIYHGLRPQFFGFFILGWFIHKHIRKNKNKLIIYFTNFILFVIFVALIAARIFNELHGYGVLYGFDFYIINYIFIILFFPKIRYITLHKNLIINNFLRWLSENSLYIYLYHGLFVYLQYI